MNGIHVMYCLQDAMQKEAKAAKLAETEARLDQKTQKYRALGESGAKHDLQKLKKIDGYYDELNEIQADIDQR